MSWFKMDDQFPTHPKVMRAGPAAAWLYIAGGCYCTRHLTDGLIPRVVVPTLTILPKPYALAAVLVAENLWNEHGDDYLVHDYLEFQPSREQVEKQREEARERRAKGGRRSADVRANDSNPIPSHPVVLTEQPSGARKRATRLPEEFIVEPEMIEWVERECPRVDWRWQTAKFVDHFKAAPGQKGVKNDWLRSWRNWMRTEQERAR